jgi:hypothetical protein
MADRDQQHRPDPERSAPDENAVEDLEVRAEEATEVVGGSFTYGKLQITYTPQKADGSG